MLQTLQLLMQIKDLVPSYNHLEAVRRNKKIVLTDLFLQVSKFITMTKLIYKPPERVINSQISN